jgi:hypothetical protein
MNPILIQNSLTITLWITAIFGAIALIDLIWRKVPNLIVYPAVIALCVMNPMVCIPNLLIGGVVGAVLYKFGFMHQHIAEGDVKIAMLLSTAWGLLGVGAFFLGIGIVAWYRNTAQDRDPLPFAPFALVALGMVLIGDQVIRAIVPG